MREEIENKRHPEEERQGMNEEGGRRRWARGEGRKEGRTQGRGVQGIEMEDKLEQDG